MNEGPVGMRAPKGASRGYGAQKGRLLVGDIGWITAVKGDSVMGGILVVRSVYVGR
jgi:hypothetical protein